MTEEELEGLSDKMKPHTEDAMRMGRAPWLPEDLVDMDELYTELTVEEHSGTAKGLVRKKITDYRQMFDNEGSDSEYLSGSKDGILHEKQAHGKKCKKKRKKVIMKGEPGIGKTSWAKKMALDWARGVFTAYSVVFFVFLKLVKPGDAIENVIIEQNGFLEGLGVSKQKIENILNLYGSKCLIILDGLDEHALGKNADVLKIIENRKYLNCSLHVTSRPHY